MLREKRCLSMPARTKVLLFIIGVKVIFTWEGSICTEKKKMRSGKK